MDVYQLLKKLNGEMVSNKAMAVIDGETVEIGGLIDNEFKLNEKGLEIAAAYKDSTPEPVKKKRARNDDGTLKGDDPSTPNINEAWENGDD